MEAKLLTAERFVDMEIGCSYRYVHSSTEYFRPHYHDYYEIFIPLNGRATHIVNGARIPLFKGIAVFIRPSDTHDYICDGGEGFDMLNITFTREIANSIFSYIDDKEALDILEASSLPPCVSLSEEDLRILGSDMNDIRLIGADKRLLKSSLRLLLLKLINRFILYPAKPHLADAAPPWLTELRERLREDNNFAEGISSIDRLCDKSREHIARSMKKYYGVTVSEYINDLRLNYIANMLRYSNHEILDIIFESGFNNVSWCYKCFAKKYGMSPLEYRNSK